jgi:hypothetical protein
MIMLMIHPESQILKGGTKRGPNPLIPLGGAGKIAARADAAMFGDQS